MHSPRTAGPRPAQRRARRR
uniref:Uncharacterized protein n=1 Tax=Arundo donax TaxID=35708 RepID=A0A0A8Y4M3_ARUDO